MKNYALTCDLVAPVSLERAFAIFEDPYNLARITPPWLNFRILSADLKMELGAEIDYQFRWCGVPLNWRTRITEYDPPYCFVDEALRSPYARWHHEHRFSEVPEGTLVSDRVEYRMPFGFVGSAVHDLLVSKQLQEIFRFRQEAIADLLGGEASEVKAPVIAAT